jgi:hypothetical protein
MRKIGFAMVNRNVYLARWRNSSTIRSAPLSLLAFRQGQVEAQVNCLKLQKRLMFGRANFDLLRLHVLRRA